MFLPCGLILDVRVFISRMCLKERETTSQGFGQTRKKKEGSWGTKFSFGVRLATKEQQKEFYRLSDRTKSAMAQKGITEEDILNDFESFRKELSPDG